MHINENHREKKLIVSLSRDSENHIQMILLFMGFVLGKLGGSIWALQWFMLYHNMITDKKAIEKAKWARFILVITFMIVMILATMAIPNPFPY